VRRFAPGVAFVAFCFTAFVASADANGLPNPHEPIPQITEKGGFLLSFDRWSVHYPNRWNTNAQIIPDGPYVPLARALSRRYRLEKARPRGGNVWYRISLKGIDAQYAAGDRIIEFEFPMPVLKVFADGAPLRDVTKGSTGFYRIAAKKGRNFLIVSPGKVDHVDVCVADFEFRFDNHIGRAIIRSPGISDQLDVDTTSRITPAKATVSFLLSNRLNSPLRGKFVMEIRNYFGEVLETKTEQIDIRPGGKPVRCSFTNTSPAQYKVVAWFEAHDGARSREYWAWLNNCDNALTASENEKRRHQLLSWGWSTRWVPESDGFRLPPPKDGWTSEFPRKRYPYQDIVEGLPLWFPMEKMPAHRMWAKCRFRTPAALGGRRVKLYMRSVSFHARIYVNGRFVAARHNHDLPDTVDLTDFLSASGENVLALGITDYITIRAKDAPKLADGQFSSGHIVDAGPFLTRYMHIGLTRPPVIMVIPEVSVRNVRIDTTFKGGKRITAATKLVNDSSRARKLVLSQAVYDRGRKVFVLGERTVTVPADGTIQTEITKPWPAAVPWDFYTPQLYELRTLVSENGKLLDRHAERFGFREWGMKGRFFYMNGKRIHPYGDGYALKNPAYFLPLAPTSSRIARIGFGSRGEKWLHIADEAGHLGTWEIFMSPFGSMGYRLAGDLIYRNLLSKWRHIIPEDRNHPGLFCYVLGNEPPTADDAICAKMFAHNEEVYKLDRTRFAQFSRGNDLGGRSRLYSPHYLFSRHNLPSDLNHFAKEKLPEKVKARLELERATGQSYEKVWLNWKKDVPVFDSEGASVTDGNEYVPWLFGEEAFVRRPDDRGRYSISNQIAQDVMRGFLYEGYRRNRISALLSHIGWRWGDESLTPVAAFLYQDEFRLFADRASDREIRVLNDTLTDETVRVEAVFRTVDGRRRARFAKTFALEAGTQKAWTIHIPPFGFKAPRYVYLILDARGERTGYHYRKKIRMTVMPAAECEPEILRGVALFDPAGKTAPVLAANGFKLRRTDSLDRAALEGARVLVIGDGALAEAEKSARIINARVKAGMRVLVLWQPKPVYSFPFHLEDGDNVADGVGAVIAAPAHPVFEGLVPEDLRFLQNAERVPLLYQNAPFIPAVGGATALLLGAKTQFPQSLDFAPLFQFKYGRGLFLVSQLMLTDSLPFDPVAAVLLRNMLAFLSSYKKGEGRFAAILDKAAEMRLKSRRGLDTSDVAFKADAPGALFVSSRAEIKSADASAVESFVRKGGTLYLKGLTPRKIEMLAERFKLKVSLRPHKSTEAVMTVRDPLFAGLTQRNWIFWRQWRGAGNYSGSLDVGREIISVDNPEAVALLEPAYIVRVPFGRGRIILDTSRWGEVNLKRAQLVTLSILGNLGAEFTAAAAAGRDWKAFAKQFHFFPIDVSAAANRDFVDTAAGDGKGGWTDEGASKGLTGFPVGLTKFNEIPFLVTDPKKTGGRGLVALKGHSWANLPAKSKEIPVGRRLDKLFIIHGCAWAILDEGEEMARYIVHYADRADWIPGKRLPFVHIPVRNKRNIYDWWFYDKIASGEYKMPEAFIAWRAAGSQKNRGVAMMEWTNPYPERVIDAIQVEATSPKSQFFFIAATGAVYKSEARKKVVPEKLSRDAFPRELADFKGKNLWKLSTEHFDIYMDSAQRIRLVTTREGTPLLDELGYWHFHTRHGKKFKHGDHQSGDYIARSRAFRSADGALTIRIRDVERKYLTWSQTITFRGPAVRVTNELVFNEAFVKHVAGGIPAVSTSVSVFDGSIAGGGKLLADENGLMVLPGKGFSVIVRFDDHFKRYKKGVSYMEKNALCRVAPTGFSMDTMKPGKKYVTDVEVEIQMTSPR